MFNVLGKPTNLGSPNQIQKKTFELTKRTPGFIKDLLKKERSVIDDTVQYFTEELNQIQNPPEHIIKKYMAFKIPPEIIRNCKGIAFARLNNVGAIAINILKGPGIVMAKTDEGEWSAPAAISMQSMGIGLRAGYTKTDIIMVLNTQKALDTFKKPDPFYLNKALKVTRGPRIITKDLEESDVYQYKIRKGTIIGGAGWLDLVVFENKVANEQFYGPNMDTFNILSPSNDFLLDVEPISIQDPLNIVLKSFEKDAGDLDEQESEKETEKELDDQRSAIDNELEIEKEQGDSSEEESKETVDSGKMAFSV